MKYIAPGSSDGKWTDPFPCPTHWHLLIVISIGAFAFPFFLSIRSGASFFHFANESLAYRFFICERLSEGEAVWLPQGQLVTAVQRNIHKVVDRVAALPSNDLRGRSNLFAFLSVGSNVLAMAFVLCAAMRSPNLLPLDKLLILAPCLIPVYGMKTEGFYYALLPDYYCLNIVIMTASVAIFLWNWRCQSDDVQIYRLFWIGGFIGLAASNKISMIVPASVTIIPLLFSARGLKELIGRVLLAAIGSITSIALVLYLIYGLNIESIVSMASEWARFIANPGSEGSLLDRAWQDYLLSHSHLYVVGTFIICFSVFVYSIFVRNSRVRRQPAIIAGAIMLVAVCSVHTVIHRPAHTTMYEASLVFVSLSAISLALSDVNVKWAVAGTVATCLFWTSYSISTRGSIGTISNMLCDSASRAEQHWSFHDDIQAMARGRQILVIFPNNEYHHEGIHEFLLKGAADFPTWNVTANGRRIIDKYSPRTTFRSEYGGTPPDAPILPSQLVVWFDRPDLPPLAEKYRSLQELVAASRDSLHRWTLFTAGGGQIHALACIAEEITEKKRGIE